MAYTVAQYRRVPGDSTTATYMKELQGISSTTVLTPSPFDPNQSFKDFAITFATVNEVNGQLETGYNGAFQAGKTYYLRTNIARVPDRYYGVNENGILKISLTLRKDATSTDIPINDTFVVNPDQSENIRYFSHTAVFTPKEDYHYLVYKLSRIAYDATDTERDWLTKADNVKYSGDQGDICQLNNICPQKPLLKMGFQARPGTLIVVNKAPIRIGRSGIYELNNGTKIYSIMITAPGGQDNSKIDAFLLDYAYES